MRILAFIIFVSFSSFSADSSGYFFDTVIRLLEQDYDMVCSKNSKKKYHCHPSNSTKIGYSVSLKKKFFLVKWMFGGKYSIDFEVFNNSHASLISLDPAGDQDDYHLSYPKTEKFYGRQLSLDLLQIVSDIKRADCNPFELELKNYTGENDSSFKVKKMRDRSYQQSKCFESDGNVIDFRSVYQNGIIEQIIIKE